MSEIPIPNSPQPPKRIPPNDGFKTPKKRRAGAGRSFSSGGRGGLWTHVLRKLRRLFSGGTSSGRGGQTWRNHGYGGSGQGGRTGFAGKKKRLW